MDPVKEVIFTEQEDQVLRDRFEFPIFFIVGGADDSYLSSLVGSPIRQLVTSKTADVVTSGNDVIGVYASRALLPTSGKARIFPLMTFLDDQWPILSNIESFDKDTKIPSNIERTWIIRALRRSGYDDLANKIRSKMLHRLYPEKLESQKIPQNWSSESFADLYLDLSEAQRKYPMIILVDDLPIKLPITIGEMLQSLSLGGYINEDNIKALQTSIQLLKISN